MTLRLPNESFTEKDIAILQKVIDGEKYETIAHDTDMALSTLKNIFVIYFYNCR